MLITSVDFPLPTEPIHHERFGANLEAHTCPTQHPNTFPSFQAKWHIVQDWGQFRGIFDLQILDNYERRSIRT